MLAPTICQAVHALDICAKGAAVGASTGAILTLPAELLIVIFVHSDCRTILRCCSVCRRFKDVIDASVELQYIIELALDGMVDGQSNALTAWDRLTHLRNLRRSWFTLDWSSTVVVPMRGACYAYELVGGVFCKTHHTHPFRWGSRHFTATWLPSSHDTGHTLIRKDLELPTRDFAIDPSQDLIVLFKGRDDHMVPNFVTPAVVELHVRTISTNKVHPEASEPILVAAAPAWVSSAFIQIVDDIVGMLLYAEPERPRLLLWNWKTGKLLVSLHGDGLPSGACDFSFISSRAFYFTSVANHGLLQIFTFGHDSPHPDAVDGVVHVADLEFPPTCQGITIINLGTHTGPFLARCPSYKLFMASNEDRVHVLTVQYIGPNRDGIRISPRYCVFFHNKLLMDFVRRYEEKGGGEPIAAPWESWGPTNTRFMLQQSTFQWLRYVHGQRVVIPRSLVQGANMIQVLDFNVRDCVRQRDYTFPREPTSVLPHPHADSDSDTKREKDKQLGGEAQTCTRLVDSATTIDQPLFFTSPFETRLPYREMKREDLVNYSGVMIDDERLVGMKYPVFSNGDMRDIHVFTM